MDPLKDSKAAETDINNRLNSRRKHCLERGIDYDEVQRDLEQEAIDGKAIENASEEAACPV